MVGAGMGDALVACCFVGPAASLGVGFEHFDVGELVGERVAESGAVMFRSPAAAADPCPHPPAIDPAPPLSAAHPAASPTPSPDPGEFPAWR